jgi:predicted nucleic acid-binding protein
VDPRSPALITFDTSGILAFLDERERHHEAVRDVVLDDGGPYVVPGLILAETAYMASGLRDRAGFDTFLDDLDAGALTFDCAARDLVRIRELMARYADMPLDFADAAVAACAERNGGRVLTLDRRDFDVIGRELALDVLPE